MVHPASCPEIAPVLCAEQDIPLHYHDQHLTLLRMQPGLAFGLGRGFLVGVQVPVDLKVSTIRYTLEDGSDYVPPYGDIHHRDEALFGVGDIQVLGGLFGRVKGTPVVMGGQIGVTLPTGATEEDPYRAGAQQRSHQHLQGGNGTVDPLGQFRLLVSGKGLGLMADASGRFPFYANEKGYQGSVVGTFGLGPLLRLPKPVDTLQFSARMKADLLSPEHWHGVPGENSGRFSLGFVIGAIWNPHPKISLLAQIEATALEINEGAQLSRPVSGTFGVSGYWAIPKRK